MRTPTAHPDGSIKQRIVDLLEREQQAMTLITVVERLGDGSGTERSILNALRALADAGRIKRMRTGRPAMWGAHGASLPPRQVLALPECPALRAAALRTAAVYGGGVKSVLAEGYSVGSVRTIEGLMRFAEACGYDLALVPKATA